MPSSPGEIVSAAEATVAASAEVQAHRYLLHVAAPLLALCAMLGRSKAMLSDENVKVSVFIPVARTRVISAA